MEENKMIKNYLAFEFYIYDFMDSKNRKIEMKDKIKLCKEFIKMNEVKE